MNEYREIQVCLLEGDIKTYSVHQTASTSYLLENLLNYLGVKQKIFFGLCYKDESKERYFLNPSLKIFDHSFLRDSSSPLFLHLCIRFFTEDILSISDLVTLNAFFLQTRFDFLQGDLPCYNVNTAYKLSSYLLHFIRASNENFDSSSLEEVFPFCLIIDNNFTPSNAWNEIMTRYTSTPVMTRNKAIIEFMKLAVKQKGYGVHYFDVKDSNNRACSLGIGMKGICVCECHDRSSIKQFFGWTKMENLFYHERKFSLDVHPENNNMTGSMHSPIPLTKFYSFAWTSANSDTAKHLYYTAVTQHQFYLDNYKKSPVTCNNVHMNSVKNSLDTVCPSREADNNNNNINNSNLYVKNKYSENTNNKVEESDKLLSCNGDGDDDGDLSNNNEDDNEVLGKHLFAMLEGLKEQKENLENLKHKKIEKLQKLSELENKLQEVAQRPAKTNQCFTVVNHNRKERDDKQLSMSLLAQLSDSSVGDDKLEDMEDTERQLCQQEHITWFYLKLLKHLSCQSKIGFTSFERSDKKWIDKYNKSLQKLRLLEKALNEQRKEVGLSHSNRSQSFREISPFLQSSETTTKNKTSNQSKSYQNINNESVSANNNISFNIFKGTSKLKGLFRSTNNSLGLKRCLSARPMAFDQDIPVAGYDNEWQSTNSITKKNKNINNYFSKESIESISNVQEKNKRASSTRLTRSASSRSTKFKQHAPQSQEMKKPSLQRYQSLEQSQLRFQQQQKLIEQQQKQQLLIQQQLFQNHQEQQKQQKTIHQQIKVQELQQKQLLQQNRLKQRQLFQKHLELQLVDHIQQNTIKKSREINSEKTEEHHLDYASMHNQSSGASSLVFSGLSLKQKLLKKYSQLTNSSYINIATGTTNSIKSNIIISNKNKLTKKNNSVNSTCTNFNYYNCNENNDYQNDVLNNNLTYQNIQHQDYSAACSVVYNNSKFNGNDAVKDVDNVNNNNCKNSEEKIYANTSNQNSFNKYLTLDSKLLRNLKNLKLKTSNFPMKMNQTSENKSNSSHNFFITNKQCNNNSSRNNCNVCYNKLYSDNLYTPPNVISFSEYQKLEERLSVYQPPYEHLFKKSSSSSASSQLSSPSSLNHQSSSPSSFQSSNSIVINAINPSKNSFSSTVQYKTNFPPFYNAISHTNNNKKDPNFVNHREVNLSFEEVNESSFDRTLVDESNIDVNNLH